MWKAMLSRNIQLYFKDKGMFFTSLITPIILLVLYVTFLGKIFTDSIRSAFPENAMPSEELIGGLVGAQLMSSLLAVCCVTVAFCSNMLMVQDKITGAKRDLTLAPIPKSLLPISYFLSTVISTLLICLTTFCICLGYIGTVGWYFSIADILWMLLDVILLVLFGAALSSVIHFFLSSQGQISAVGTIVSAGYGFICGAYMPISTFGDGLQTVLSFFPSTYATALIRSHTMRGALEQLKQEENIPAQAIESLQEGLGCNTTFFEHTFSQSEMFFLVLAVILVLLGLYILLHRLVPRR